MNQTLLLIFAVLALFAVFLVFLLIWVSRFAKVGPDQVMIVSGRKYVFTDTNGRTQTRGFRLVTGGGTFVWPVLEKVGVLSLKPVLVELVAERIPARDGARFQLRVKAQLRIASDEASLLKAAQNLPDKSPQEINSIAGQLIEASLRSLIGDRTSAEISQNQPGFQKQLEEAIKPSLGNLGLELLGFSILDIKTL